MAWVIVRNHNDNAWGCTHPRPGEGTRDLQVGGFDFEVLTEEEYAAWQMSPEFRLAEETRRITVERVDAVPRRRQQLPAHLRTSNSHDMAVAYDIAITSEQYDDVQLARINLFRSDEEGRLWDREADLEYLKTRHRDLLKAAEWYLENFVDKRSGSQNRRLRDIKRQLKAIDSIG